MHITKTRFIVFMLLVATSLMGCQQNQGIPTVTQVPTVVVPQPTNNTTNSTSPSVTVTDLSWKEQQEIWTTWHHDMKYVVDAVGTTEDKAELAYMDKYGSLSDNSKGQPSPLGGKYFHIVVVDNVPHSDWQTQHGPRPLIFANYDNRITTLFVKKSDSPFKIRGTIGLHEGRHAMQLRSVSPDRNSKLSSALQHGQDEIEAYTPQVRQIRAMYSPKYEVLRTYLVKLISDDMKQRQQNVHNDKENFEASLPNLYLVRDIMNQQSLIKQAFSADGDITFYQALTYINFAFLDASFQVIDDEFPDPEIRKIMKPSFILYLDRQMGKF